MSNPKISIICPVYNAEKTIHKCIDSILAQTFVDWELLLVNDGSTDNSDKICDRYAEKDRRIRVIHQQNGGVSAARQVGLDLSIGDYVIHVDPDDWIESCMLHDLYYKAVDEHADVVICDFYIDNNGLESCRVEQKPSSLDPKTVLSELFQQLHGSCCNKLAKRACYSNYGIKFPVGLNYCEDLLIWVQLFSHDVKIAYQPRAYYHYCYNNNSITQRFSRKLYDQSRMVVALLEKLYPENEHKQAAINRHKMNIKTAAFSNPAFFRGSEYYRIYPEINKFILKRKMSIVNNLLMRISYIHGFFRIGTGLYRLKNHIRGNS